MDILDFDLDTNVYPVSTISMQSHNSHRYEVNTYQMQADVSIQTFNLINGLKLVKPCKMPCHVINNGIMVI